MDRPETRYARAPDSVHITYQVTGEGPSSSGPASPVEDRGTHALKGVPDEWRIYAVAN
jgi:hypothetical protein